MRPKFLLDEHFPQSLAAAAVRARLDVLAVVATDLRGRDDLRILQAAVDQDRILITYDQRDFRPLLSEMIWAGVRAPGLVAVSSRTFRSNDLKGLLRALLRLAGRIERGEVDPSMGITLTK